MHESDFGDFRALLDQTCTALSKGTYKPDPQSTAIWFRALSVYGMDLVRAGFDAHLRDPDRGRFVPVPADIIGKIQASDGRVSADEAWAIAAKASDEHATVTWNDEIAEAWGICKPVFDGGDEVGARMAFKAAYSRITEAAKRTGKRSEWTVSLGWDAEGRAPEVARAASAGRIGHDAPLALEMSGQAMVPHDQVPPQIREALMKLRQKFTTATKEKADAEVKPQTPPLRSSHEDVHGARGPNLLDLGIVGAKRREMGLA